MKSQTQAEFPAPKAVSGKKLVPIILIGFVVFTALGFYGTYYLAQTVAPMSPETVAKMKVQAEDQMRARGDKK